MSPDLRSGDAVLFRSSLGFAFALALKAEEQVGKAKANQPRARLIWNDLVSITIENHSHPKRLNRPTLNDAAYFGDENYSKEELVAEMGAAYLCGLVGI